MIENWRPVVGFAGSYEVSDHGRVRSVNRIVCGQRHRGKVLAHGVNTAGYRMVILSRNGWVKAFQIHQLVAFAFIGPRPLKNDVNHIDLNKQNNCPRNLEYLSRRSNIKHAIAGGAWDKYLAPVMRSDGIAFKSIKDAARALGGRDYLSSHIHGVLTGRRKTCGGFSYRRI